MGLISRTSFSDGDVPTTAEWNTQFNTAYTEINGSLDSANIDLTDTYSWTGAHNFVSATSTNLNITTDIYTAAWTDYASSSTITGWSSITTKTMYYKKIGKTVIINFNITGTSNNASTTFTLPYASSSVDQYALINYTDNGTDASYPGILKITGPSSTATLYTAAYGAWTAANAKTVRGQIIYETA